MALPALLLFLAFAALALLLAYPDSYGTSPLGLALDAARFRLLEYLRRGDRGQLYEITGRDPLQVAKAGLLIGAGMGLAAALLAKSAWGFFFVPLLAAGGLLLFDSWVVIEFRQWQDSLLAGVPVLVQFMPAFLETGAITPRRALELTVPFLPEPLRGEMAKAVGQLSRTGRVEALDDLARRAAHPVLSAVCFRLQATWDTGARPDIFADLADQVRNLEEVAAARATAAKSGLIALLCVIGLIGAGLEFGYPAWAYFTGTMGGMFGK